jgi:hypothetical protein
MNRKHIIAIALTALGTTAFAQEATPDTWTQAQSTKSVEQVRAELVQARKDGTIKFGGAGYMEKVTSAKSRDQLRAEVDAARRNGELGSIGAEAHAFAPAAAQGTTVVAGRN